MTGTLPDPWAGSYWTAADAAELDVSVWNLTGAYLEHRSRCARCAGPLPCPHLQEAIAALLEWRATRHLASRCEALRADDSGRPPAEGDTP